MAARSWQHRDLTELRLRAQPGLEAQGDPEVLQPLAGFSIWEIWGRGNSLMASPAAPAQQPLWEHMDELFAAKEEVQ